MSTYYRNKHRTKADIAIGRYLAEVRVRKDLSQTELADAMTEYTGVEWNQVTVSNIERGRTPVTLSQWKQLEAVLGELMLPFSYADVETPMVNLSYDDGGRARIKP